MKNLKILSALFLGLLIMQACGDKEAEGTKNADIVGTWTVTSLNFDITVNNESLTSFFGSNELASIYEALLTTTFEEAFDGVLIELKADNTYTASSPGEPTEEGTWTLNSSDNTLTLDAGSIDETTFKILSSSSSALVLQLSEINADEDLDQDGTNDEFKITLDMTLTK